MGSRFALVIKPISPFAFAAICLSFLISMQAIAYTPGLRSLINSPETLSQRPPLPLPQINQASERYQEFLALSPAVQAARADQDWATEIKLLLQAQGIAEEIGDEELMMYINGEVASAYFQHEFIALYEPIVLKRIEFANAKKWTLERMHANYDAGRLFFKMSRYAEAKPYVELAIELSKEFNDPSMTGWALLELSWIHFRLGQPEKTEPMLTESLVIQAGIKDYGSAAKVGRDLASYYVQTDRIDDAVHMITHSLKLAQASGALYFEASLHNLLGGVLLKQQGNKDQAVLSYQRAIDLCTQAQRFDGVLMFRNSLGLALHNEGLNEEAETYLRVNLNQARELGAKRDIIDFSQNLAVILGELNKLDQAVALLHDILNDSKYAWDSLQRVDLATSLSYYYGEQERFEQAEAVLQPLLLQVTELPDVLIVNEYYQRLTYAIWNGPRPESLPALLNKQAELHRQQGHALLADRLYKGVADYYKKEGDHASQKEALAKIENKGITLDLNDPLVGLAVKGWQAFKAKDYRTSIYWLTQAIELVGDRQDEFVFEIYVMLGESLGIMKRYTESTKMSLRAIEIFDAVDDITPEMQIRGLYSLGVARRLQNRISESITALQRAQEILGTILDEGTPKVLMQVAKQIQSQWFVLKKYTLHLQVSQYIATLKERLGDPLDVATFKIEVAVWFADNGRGSMAAEFVQDAKNYMQSIERDQRLATAPLRHIQAMLGKYYFQSKLHAESNRYHLPLADYFHEQQDILGIIQTSFLMAVSFAELKNHPQAIAYYKKCFEYADSTANPEFYFNLHLGLTGQYEIAGQIEEAKQALRLFIKDAQEADLPGKESIAWQNLGKIFFEQKQFPEAVQHSLKARQLAATSGDAYMIGQTLNSHGCALLNNNQLVEAEQVLKEAINHFDRYPQDLESRKNAHWNLAIIYQRQKLNTLSRIQYGYMRDLLIQMGNTEVAQDVQAAIDELQW